CPRLARACCPTSDGAQRGDRAPRPWRPWSVGLFPLDIHGDDGALGAHDEAVAIVRRKAARRAAGLHEDERLGIAARMRDDGLDGQRVRLLAEGVLHSGPRAVLDPKFYLQGLGAP